MGKIKQLNKYLHTPLWLFILLVVVVILRIPSFFEPYSYGDEMIYLTLGEAIRRGIPLYKEIHDNKPPLLYLAAAIAGSLFWFKVILTVWHIGTVFIFWKFVEKLFPGKSSLHKLSTILFALLSTFPLLEGNIANAEIFMIGPIILAFYLLLPKKSDGVKLMPKKSAIAGFLFAVATLFKVPAAFDLPAIIFLWLAISKFSLKSVKIVVLNSMFLAVGFLTPILATFLLYWLQGALPEYVIAAFLQNFGYLSSWRPGDVKEPFLVKNGPLLVRASIVAFVFLILFIAKNKLSRQFIFLTSWLLLTLFAVTLSERPYPHYLLQSVAPLSIMAAMLVTLQTMEQVLVIIPLTIALYVPVRFNFWHYKTLDYYQRFYNYSIGQITQDEYLQSFDGNLFRNYAVSEYILKNTLPEEKIFVWGNSSVIYALSRRLPPIKYVADYHISDFSSKDEVIDALRKDPPKFIVFLPDSSEFAQLQNFAKTHYGFTENIEGADVWILIGPT